MNWEPAYIILIIISTLVDYSICLRIPNSSEQRKKRLLAISLITNLGILFVFKYFNFFTDNVYDILNGFGLNLSKPTLNLLLPVGISFYTFQTLSYSIDVYRGKLAPEKHLGKFALYVSFFPQLVAGPIERATSLLPQLQKNDQKINYENFVVGLTQFVHGLFKKVVVADTLSIYVDTIYAAPGSFSGFTLLFATILFAIQIYCDFSGYTDMAIGCARMLGYKLMENFNLPYYSVSVTEFWRKWHISLSSWINDYLFLPMAKKYVAMWSKNGMIFSLLFTFTIIGLWHGANWTFVLFGVLHGLVLAFEFSTKKRRKKIGKKLGKKVWTVFGWFGFMFFYLISLILFRSDSITNAWIYIKRMLFNKDLINLKILDIQVFFNIIFAASVLILIDHFIMRKVSYQQMFNSKTKYWLVSFNLFLLLLVILFGVSEGSQFIYFQF